MCYLYFKPGIDSGNFISEIGAGAVERTGYKTSKAGLRLESLRNKVNLCLEKGGRRVVVGWDYCPSLLS